ncbi:2-amino-4-hydroxy-6-hydroxymethyldihydropteridine diphosphokinase [Tropicimonas sediminicola]|uniref:2-amino-4-hydroxy-6-hydroxymethyldihydropteridine pyrophosphokinase n=1 Tax=Tropicimonas sediminicola TaxID=1031541 RepID=A0A239I664_9RHOB|nr:2-amino-4-hydroxy-6-hydroxymethyldihydropteridinediphosphokinase [Tropicimonas sediminicola]
MISIGSNVAALGMLPKDLAFSGIEALEGDGVRIVAASRLYATPCMPAGAGPDYVNAAVVVETALAAGELLAHLHAVEQRFERSRTQRWGARSLDLDLLDFGGVVLPDRATWEHWRALPFERQREEAPDQLILPHPRIQDRAFVLVPLAEIAPGWVHPVLGQSVTELCAGLTEADMSGIVPLECSESLALLAKGR